ncbi:MAG: hypothetical protein U0520_04480 [Candidatus Saccharimonadales bacterium]
MDEHIPSAEGRLGALIEQADALSGRAWSLDSLSTAPAYVEGLVLLGDLSLTDIEASIKYDPFEFASTVGGDVCTLASYQIIATGYNEVGQAVHRTYRMVFDPQWSWLREYSGVETVALGSGTTDNPLTDGEMGAWNEIVTDPRNKPLWRLRDLDEDEQPIGKRELWEMEQLLACIEQGA